MVSTSPRKRRLAPVRKPKETLRTDGPKDRKSRSLLPLQGGAQDAAPPEEPDVEAFRKLLIYVLNNFGSHLAYTLMLDVFDHRALGLDMLHVLFKIERGSFLSRPLSIGPGLVVHSLLNELTFIDLSTRPVWYIRNIREQFTNYLQKVSARFELPEMHESGAATLRMVQPGGAQQEIGKQDYTDIRINWDSEEWWLKSTFELRLPGQQPMQLLRQRLRNAVILQRAGLSSVYIFDIGCYLSTPPEGFAANLVSNSAHPNVVIRLFVIWRSNEDDCEVGSTNSDLEDLDIEIDANDEDAEIRQFDLRDGNELELALPQQLPAMPPGSPQKIAAMPSGSPRLAIDEGPAVDGDVNLDVLVHIR